MMLKRLFILAFCLWPLREALATEVVGTPTLTATNITFETNGTPNGTTVQFTLDSGGKATINFLAVSPVDGTLSIVGTLIQTYATGGAKTIFWNALWLIGSDFGRRDGTFLFQVVPSTNGTDGTPAPLAGDPAGRFTIDSLDIHNLTVTSSFDANQSPTFPYTISYQLAKSARVTASIANSSGTLVRTLITAQAQASEATSTATITWDGLGNDLKPVAIGNYVLTVSAADLNSADQAIPRTRNISVVSLAGAASNPQKLFEDNVFVYPNPVRNGAATFQMEAVRDGANLSLKIYTLTGDLVREQSFPGVAAGNIASFAWDVTNQAGRKLGRGLYYYVVREDDAQGTLQTVKKMAVLP